MHSAVVNRNIRYRFYYYYPHYYDLFLIIAVVLSCWMEVHTTVTDSNILILRYIFVTAFEHHLI